jgi:hypothetical protein
MVKELSSFVGKSALWHVFAGIAFTVVIKDAKQVFGRTDLLIVPTNGEGQKWVSAGTVELTS